MSFEYNVFFKKLGAVGELTGAEKEALGEFLGRPRTFEAGTSITRESPAGNSTFVLLRGWVASSRTLANGKSQIIDFRVPGDLLNARGDVGGDAGLDLMPLTYVEICKLQAPIDVVLRQSSPRVAAALLWSMTEDARVLAEHLVNVGRRDPRARTAHLLLELGVRLQRLGLGTRTRFKCPLTQMLLADALGMSGIHLNRILRLLRELGLVRFQRHLVEIDDVEKLASFAGFNQTYLE
ncbi:Crp/Fnr family transcriptional regulator [Pikeienuella sp. HZG-20]|uniref:Crp/Fnr family transcriptional regulator n=1 Tax=Paludibacillus litoralis TaxID=3133267 RepID=UPI0030EE1AC7